MRMRNLNPIVNLFSERLKYDELVFTRSEAFKEQHIVDSLDMLCGRIVPSITIAEDKTGVWHVHNGSHFLQGILCFVRSEYAYPKDGNLESFRGKTFEQLPRSEQRNIREFTIATLLIDTAEIKEDNNEFTRLSELVTKLT